MQRFIRELRRREVFSTAGLYVGVCWIIIEVGSVMLPTFDAPDWILRAMIIAALVGFPITLVLAWIYDVTDKGIDVQADPTDTIVEPLGSRKMDFIVIGVLTVALTFSVYLNLTSEDAPLDDPDPVSILIANFENGTGNALFDGLLEQALSIGIEGAPHITSFQRTTAQSLAKRLQDETATLTADSARLVAVREGIGVVLSGSIRPDGGGFELTLNGLNPETGDAQFELTSEARSGDAVLTAVGRLSEDVRKRLGDTTVGESDDATTETFTAASLEAAGAYIAAIDLAFAGEHQQAITFFEQATELDPNFGRAYSGWALSEFKLGRTETAGELWDTALSLMNTMTERERLRTLGLYYAGVTGNIESAVQSFAELVEKFPADAAARNNLAVTSFMTLDFETASEQGRLLLDIYPTSQLYQSNYALYAMYSGNFEKSKQVATEMVADDPTYGVPYLPIAIALLAEGDIEGARNAYEQMKQSERGTYGLSLAYLGLADIDIYTGNHTEARVPLAAGIELDIGNEDRRGAAVKQIALAETFVADNEKEAAQKAIAEALELNQGLSVKVSAALLLLQLGDTEAAGLHAAELSSQVQSQNRAYGKMLTGMIQSASGEHADAIDSLRDALDAADLWLIRRELGKAFLAAGFSAEALAEFRLCEERRGEATAAFLDDSPTYRLLATLPLWTQEAERGLGMAAVID